MKNKEQLSTADQQAFFKILQQRFEKNMQRHKAVKWETILQKLGDTKPSQLWSLYAMERTGGEPDVIAYDGKTGAITFADCAPESPKERRSLCYDREALDARKENKPAGNAVEMAASMGTTLLGEKEYRRLQELGAFDTKTSSWIDTPESIRKLGGALFCDRRYDTVFVYHNGAESYYAARGFRTSLTIL